MVEKKYIIYHLPDASGGVRVKVPNRILADSDEGNWITINGTHLLIKDGETPGDAFKRTTGKELPMGGEGKARIVKGESANENAVYRITDPKTSKFAEYDKEGNRLPHGGWSQYAPTEEMGATWDSRAKDIVKGAKESGLEDPTREIYIRFGRVPEKGKSMNHATGEFERGTSAYRGKYNPESGLIDFAENSGHGGGLLPLLLSGKTPYIISGKEVGIGSDGEPLLKNAKIEKTLVYGPLGYKIKK